MGSLAANAGAGGRAGGSHTVGCDGDGVTGYGGVVLRSNRGALWYGSAAQRSAAELQVQVMLREGKNCHLYACWRNNCLKVFNSS